MAVIHCQNLNRSFQQGDAVVKGLDEVSLTIEKGEFVCLSGPSGSGKTTLLNAIGALDKLDSGELSINGVRIDNLSQHDRAEMRLNTVGFVFQAYNLIPVLSACENVEFVMQVQGVAADIRREKALSILAEVGLAGLEHRRPAQLSGGQQQRVAVARAIVSEPSLVLADEPTANLDSKSSKNLMELFVKLNTMHGITFVIATHDESAMAYCRRMIRMVDGKIVSDTPQDAVEVL
ncbi:ABC transporter ATP-binding protein [Umboniibacter marinipuniceus]|uniref:Putative ABC transport system ATP-binding protein n=1 Tax=Umboniibacter marinipuniceus TaxID=569599 RepID=A0A3M0A1B4_9GAMM|nr:ABC transporter ATP-binding protein [Umboniibacter marinipuniceus]RMA78743.1 putative ABC transport system ATP-binding protein [Umboniibacter marinipuniceus]